MNKLSDIEERKLQKRIENLEKERDLFLIDLARVNKKGSPSERVIIGSFCILIGIISEAVSIINQTKMDIWFLLFVLIGIVIFLFGRSDYPRERRLKRRISELDQKIAKLRKL
jgi:hypothetical protein